MACLGTLSAQFFRRVRSGDSALRHEGGPDLAAALRSFTYVGRSVPEMKKPRSKARAQQFITEAEQMARGLR